ncbi:MAG: SRPBCC family protein [Pedobacter sp.]|uniref:SRPBCC family protein n=1 Tax=Pedobacter sp. TaxID=1411316 RepID=UPI002806A2E5|nr:SRPBCC family protein [Pedobacter sp.]MDQ8005235.1 SRPBCC family protein [Pedobacter sp.]
MKFLKIFLVVIVVFIAIFLIGGLFLPKVFSVTRTTNIAANDTVVYKNIADLNNFLQWNAWSKMDPKAKVEITGIPEQAGHTYHWKGEKAGEGEMRLEAVKPVEEIKIAMRFIEPFESAAKTQFNLSKESDSTKVTWTISGENNIFSKWMCAFGIMDKTLGKDFEDGLKSLKEMSEKK